MQEQIIWWLIFNVYSFGLLNIGWYWRWRQSKETFCWWKPTSLQNMTSQCKMQLCYIRQGGMSASHHRRIPPTETPDLEGHLWVNRVPWWQNTPTHLRVIILNNPVSLHLPRTLTHTTATHLRISPSTLTIISDFDLRDKINLEKKVNEQNETKWLPILMLKIPFQYHVMTKK